MPGRARMPLPTLTLQPTLMPMPMRMQDARRSVLVLESVPMLVLAAVLRTQPAFQRLVRSPFGRALRRWATWSV